MKRQVFAVALVVAFGLGVGEAAARQAFVSRRGRDANRCTRGAPCKSLQRALTRAGDGGQVVILDSTTLAPATIGASVSIVASGGAEVSLVAPANASAGLVIDAPDIVVSLRGLSISTDPSAPANYGILVQQAASVQIEDCVVEGFGTYGIYLNAVGAHSILATTVRGNARSGVVVGNFSGRVRAVLERVRALGNGSGSGTLWDAGIAVEPGGDVAIVDSLVANNFRGILLASSTAGQARAVAERCVVANNVVGLFTRAYSGPSTDCFLGVSASSITGNTLYGIEQQALTAVTSYGDNTVWGNGALETFGATTTKK